MNFLSKHQHVLWDIHQLNGHERMFFPCYSYLMMKHSTSAGEWGNDDLLRFCDWVFLPVCFYEYFSVNITSSFVLWISLPVLFYYYHFQFCSINLSSTVVLWIGFVFSLVLALSLPWISVPFWFCEYHLQFVFWGITSCFALWLLIAVWFYEYYLVSIY